MSISLLIVVVYLVGVTAAASALMRRSNDAEGWTVASGRMGLWMVAAGVAGTRIGGVGTYGVAGNVMTSGLWNLWYAVNTFLALALVGIFFAKAYRRLQLVTVSEIFIQRFGSRRCQILTSLCVQTEYLIVNVLEPLVIGSILATLTGLPFGITVFIGAAILILATTLGGLWGNALANMVHCVTIVVGLLAVALLGLDRIGGFAELRAGVDAALVGTDITPERWWSPVGAGWAAVIAMFFSATVHTPAASVYVNFATAARSARMIVPAFLLGGVIAAVMPLLAGWVGAEALAVYGSSSGLSSYAAITQLAVDTNVWIGGLALAAVLAAVISSGGPILLAGTTLLLRDWVPAYQKAEPARQLTALRAVTVAYGLIAAAIAWKSAIGSILELLLLGFAMVVPPAVAVGAVLYWPRATERACYWGMIAGYGVGLAWYVLGESLDWVAWWADPSYPTTVLPLVVIPLVSWLDRAPENDGEEFYRRLEEA